MVRLFMGEERTPKTRILHWFDSEKKKRKNRSKKKNKILPEIGKRLCERTQKRILHTVRFGQSEKLEEKDPRFLPKSGVSHDIDIPKFHVGREIKHRK